MPQQEISANRKLVYYLGIAAILLGIILFINAFYQTRLSFENNFNRGLTDVILNQNSRPRVHFPFGGMIMLFIGIVMTIIGKRGLSGSGIILSAEGERKDLEPWNRSKGRQIQDMLEETHLDDLLASKSSKTAVIKIRCTNCKSVNDETDLFCGQCGKKI